MRQKLKTMGLLWVALGLAVVGPLKYRLSSPICPSTSLSI